MSLDLEALKKAAEGATPGPWFAEKRITTGDPCVRALGGEPVAELWFNGQEWLNAAFIALANPVTVLELLARLKVSERDGARLRAAIPPKKSLAGSDLICVHNKGWNACLAAIDAQIAARKE